MFKSFIKVVMGMVFLLPSLPVKTHLLEQSEEECKIYEMRNSNCEFKRIRKPNNLYSDFQYKFTISKNKNPSWLDKYKRYPSREGATYSHHYAMIHLKFDNNKTIKERGIISIYPSVYTFQSRNIGYLVGTSCINIWYKNKKYESVCKQDFWDLSK